MEDYSIILATEKQDFSASRGQLLFTREEHITVTAQETRKAKLILDSFSLLF
jgi:hypothetical protein